MAADSETCFDCGEYLHDCCCADYEREDDDCDFADPGGRSALRAESPTNPRIHPCPTCERENMLTPKDVARGYQCDYCADEAEGGGY